MWISESPQGRNSQVERCQCSASVHGERLTEIDLLRKRNHRDAVVRAECRDQRSARLHQSRERLARDALARIPRSASATLGDRREGGAAANRSARPR
jgi:hypothetical protein